MLAAGGQCSHCRQFGNSLVRTQAGESAHWLCASCSAGAVLLDLLAETHLTENDRALVCAQLREVLGFCWARISAQVQRELGTQPAAACLELVPDGALELSSSSEDLTP